MWLKKATDGHTSAMGSWWVCQVTKPICSLKKRIKTREKKPVAWVVCVWFAERKEDNKNGRAGSRYIYPMKTENI